MDLPTLVTERLPSLRRLARAMVGQQQLGDQAVAAALERVISSDTAQNGDTGRVHLYRHVIDSLSDYYPSKYDLSTNLREKGFVPERRLQELPSAARLTFLLATMEGLSNAEIAAIRDVELGAVEQDLQCARAAIGAQLATCVLIIEDEPFVAADLESIVVSLGHNVVAKVATRHEAVSLAAKQPPGLILSDVQLADGSNGFDAVSEILESLDVPVVFITAFPERLLTGERPEPAFIIEKPFRRDDVTANVSQALFFASAAG